MRASREDCIKLIECAIEKKIAPLSVYSISTGEGQRLIATDPYGTLHLFKEVLGRDEVVDLTTPQPKVSITMQGTKVHRPEEPK